ncbi:MAG: hypothetical protein KF708_14330 [Pirellulales bacterium]|nr:hypothetical protein [Pirellulales bacterium]
MSNSGRTNARRLDVFGDSMLGKLPASSRKRRKRQASKRRRARLRSEGLHESESPPAAAD